MDRDDKIYYLLKKLYFETQEMKANIATKDDLLDKLYIDTQDIKTNMATKDDFDLLRVELREEIQEVATEVRELRNDLNTMEILTTKNAYDIAKLKAVK